MTSLTELGYTEHQDSYTHDTMPAIYRVGDAWRCDGTDIYATPYEAIAECLRSNLIVIQRAEDAAAEMARQAEDALAHIMGRRYEIAMMLQRITP